MNARAGRRVLLACALALAGCDAKKKEQGPPTGPPPAAVHVAVAAAGDVPVYLEEIGRSAAREVVTLRPQVSGRITKIHVADGADVKAGEILVTIDARPFQAELAAAEAALAQAKAALDLARVDSTRVAGLLEKKAAAQQEVDTAKNAVAVSEARVQQGQAAVETARLNLEYATLRSPIDGRAGRRLVDAGNIVTANDTVLLVVQRMDPIYVDFSVSERELPAVRKSLAKAPPRVEVRIPDDPAPPRAGELTFVDNAVQEGTGTVQLRATIANPEHGLWPGLFVKVRVILDTLKGAVLVPGAVVQMSARGPFVYVVNAESTAEIRPVTIGQRHDDRVVIVSGLKPGERVISVGSMMVMPGSKVKVEEPPAAGKGAKEPGP